MVGGIIAGLGVSGLGSLGPSVTIICGTPDDAASGCVACKALLPSVWISDHQIRTFSRAWGVLMHTCHMSVFHLICFVHAWGPKVDKPDEMKNAAQMDELCH